MPLKAQLDVDYREMVATPTTGWLNTVLRALCCSPVPAPPPRHQHRTSGKLRTIVCISDTHGLHRKLTMPRGDILIHAGDYVLHGNKDHAVDFNLWLGQLPYRHRIVVQGNHEHNASWKKEVKSILSNATLLQNESIKVEGLNIYGTGFFWKCKEARNPYFDLIPLDTDIVVAHNPAMGYVDGGKGCPALLNRMKEVRPALVVSGHVHEARNAVRGSTSELENTVFVNAATVSDHKHLAKQPIFVRL